MENARRTLTVADGYIGSWEAKYHYSYWRPSRRFKLPTPTAIQHRGRSYVTPLQLTYPMPDYDSPRRSGWARRPGSSSGPDHQVQSRSLTLPAGAGALMYPGAPFLRQFLPAENENGRVADSDWHSLRLAVEEGTNHGRKIARRAVSCSCEGRIIDSSRRPSTAIRVP